MPRPVLSRDDGLRWVQMCMRVGLNQTKNGLRSRTAPSMKSVVAFRNSSSIVSMRFLVSGPVSSHFCLPQGPKRGSSPGVSVAVATRAELCLEIWALRIVGILGLLLGVEVIEVAEERVEAVHGRQELVAVAEMVLAELAGRVALRLEQLGNRRVLLRQPLFGGR